MTTLDISVSQREFDWIMAALRYYQLLRQPVKPSDSTLTLLHEAGYIRLIATEHGPEPRSDQLDTLCQRLNLGGAA